MFVRLVWVWPVFCFCCVVVCCFCGLVVGFGFRVCALLEVVLVITFWVYCVGLVGWYGLVKSLRLRFWGGGNLLCGFLVGYGGVGDSVCWMVASPGVVLSNRLWLLLCLGCCWF